MIDHDKKLQVQAHLDQELSGREGRAVAAWLESDPEAKALQAELHGIRQLLRVGEPELKVPESREFYWSKIQRGIEQESAQAARPSRSSGAWWLRILAPAMGGLVLLAAVLSLIRFSSSGPSMAYLHEIETPLEDTSAISFHSQAAGMTVVWVQQSPSN